MCAGVSSKLGGIGGLLGWRPGSRFRLGIWAISCRRFTGVGCT